MNVQADILCIGSVLWDVIGRSSRQMRQGSDVPGRITRLPGGVALNIAMTLKRFAMTPALLSAVGKDAEGEELMAACHALGLITDTIYRPAALPTDTYMAVEGANGLIAAIADAHTLEAAGDHILRPLRDGTLASPETPYQGLVALDGNLTTGLLEEIANSAMFAKADLRVAPASPGKAERLMPFIHAGRGTLYVNLEEAGLLCNTTFQTSKEAALALLARGCQGVLVTNGAEAASEGCHLKGCPDVITHRPCKVEVTRITGAGDTFMAAHIAAQARDADRISSLKAALKAAATYVSGDPVS